MKKIVVLSLFFFGGLYSISRAFDADCYYPVVKADIPCYYFRMNATSGTTQDGQGFFGVTDSMTIVNSPTLNATGIPGANPDPATTFNGTTQWEGNLGGGAQDCQSDATAGPARPCDSGVPHDSTVEVWAKPRILHGGTIYARAGDGSPDPPPPQTFEDDFGTDPGGTLSCVQWTNGSGAEFSRVQSIATYDAARWVYAGCQVTGSPYKIQVFVNGVLDNSSTTTSGTCQGLGPHFMVGAYGQFSTGSWPQNFFDGTIDEVATYNRKLTPTEIAEHYSVGITFDSCFDWPFNVKQERHLLEAPDGITSESLRAEAFVRRVTTPDICGTTASKPGLG